MTATASRGDSDPGQDAAQDGVVFVAAVAEALRPAVVGQLRYVVQMIKASREGEFRRSLYGIAAELARLAGWTYFDVRQYSQARVYFTEVRPPTGLR
ncbi:hypothetical protein AB0F42_01920 [Streptomyces buecherae]|uniref:hypothetical protein n=1 Tax=Streptomyces buecherae TaxID=2763006 RepID=UPI0033C1EFD8